MHLPTWAGGVNSVRTVGLGALGGFGKHRGAGLGARRAPLGVEKALGGGCEFCEDHRLGCIAQIRQAYRGTARGSERASLGRECTRRGVSSVRTAGLGVSGGFGKHTGAGLGAQRGLLGAERALGGGCEFCEDRRLGCIGRIWQAYRGRVRGSERASRGGEGLSGPRGH